MRKKTADREERSFRERAADVVGIPKDVVCGAPVLTIVGRSELLLENYRGIQEYTEELIRIQTKTGQIKLTGRRLRVEYYTNDEMKVTGRFSGIEYL